MRVEQNNAGIIDFLQQNTMTEENGPGVVTKEKAAVDSTGVSSAATVNMKDATYMKPQAKEEKSVAEMLEQGAALDARDRKNQMAVLSNTTSEEDYAKMQKEGFSLDETSSGTIVTVTDKIKAQLAKAGVDISYFGDDLDLAEMEKITGSAEMTAQLAAALKQADLPLTKENQREAAEALMQALSLNTPTDGAIKYMFDNGLLPTIANLYMAENSGCSAYQTGKEIDTSFCEDQIEKVIRDAGLTVNDETMAESKWLIENEIPLTDENLQYLEALRNFKPISEMSWADEAESAGAGTWADAAGTAGAGTQAEAAGVAAEVSAAIAEAVASGGRPADAVLAPDYSLSEKAQDANNVVNSATDEDLEYIVGQGMELTVQNLRIAAANRETASAKRSGDGSRPDDSRNIGVPDYTEKGLALLKAKRQLEETRLAMSTEANLALLKKGISIDTKPLAELVDNLKDEENSYYRNLLESQGVEPTEENTALFKETIEKITDIKEVPAYVLGQKNIDIPTVNAIHKAGTQLRDIFEKANERYETLMTAPRADLGDSIHKAFRNVDDILRDLQLEASDANRRAVRILGYNGLEINRESVAQMKAADEEVQRVFRNMTPQVVTKMIKEGINPLSMDFENLNKTAEQIKAASGTEETEKFSEYLWKLEQNRQISPEERSSYIGIYRLIHQVESGDGAAIGALIHQGAELSMKNLLTAVRSGKKSGKVDVSVDETTGALEEAGYKGTSITEQIEAAYQMNCIKDVTEVLTPEAMRNVLQKVRDWEELTPEQLKQALQQAQADAKNGENETDSAYIKEQLLRLEHSANASSDIYEVLQKYDIPNTVNHVLALEAMRADRNRMFRKVFGTNGKDTDGKVDVRDLEKIKQELIEEFGEAVKSPKEMAIAQEKLGELAENVMKGMITDGEVTSIDVREMRQMMAELSVNSFLAKQEQYSVPVMVNDGIVNVSLKIVRGVDKKGLVDIMMESELRGKIAATFQAKENGISGLFATDNMETKKLFEENSDLLVEALRGQGDEAFDLHYAYMGDLDFNHFSMGVFGEKAESEGKQNESEGESYQVQTTRLYHIAESFIRQIRSLA